MDFSFTIGILFASAFGASVATVSALTSSFATVSVASTILSVGFGGASFAIENALENITSNRAKIIKVYFICNPLKFNVLNQQHH